MEGLGCSKWFEITNFVVDTDENAHIYCHGKAFILFNNVK